MKYLLALVALAVTCFNVPAQNVDVNVNRANVRVRTNDNVAQIRVNSRFRPAVAAVRVTTTPARVVGGFYRNNIVTRAVNVDYYNTQNVVLRNRVEYVPTETVIVEQQEAVPTVKRVILRNTATYGTCGGVSQFSGGGY